MDKRLIALRFVADWALVLMGVWAMLSWFPVSGILFLAAYAILLMVTEFAAYQETTQQLASSKPDQKLYLFEDGSTFIGTEDEFNQFIEQKMKEEEEDDGETSGTEDKM